MFQVVIMLLHCSMLSLDVSEIALLQPDVKDAF